MDFVKILRCIVHFNTQTPTRVKRMVRILYAHASNSRGSLRFCRLSAFNLKLARKFELGNTLLQVPLVED